MLSGMESKQTFGRTAIAAGLAFALLAFVGSTRLEAQAIFIRGDANGDGVINIADTITILSFLGDVTVPTPGAIEASDVNDNGTVEIADVSYLNGFLFGGLVMAPPFPAAGVDPTPDVTFPAAMPSPDYVFALDSTISSGAAGDLFTVLSTLTNLLPVDGIEQRVVYDAAEYDLISTSGSASLETLLGIVPAFYLETDSPGEFVVVSLFDFFGSDSIPTGVQVEILSFEFNVGLGVLGTIDIDVSFEDDPVSGIYNAVSIDGLAETPTLQGTLGAPGGTDPEYRRGDTNNDGSINLSDAVYLLGNLFPGVGIPTVLECLDSADCNGDGSLNISDPVTLLGAQFGAPTTPLPAPYPDCGAAPLMGCVGYLSCP